MYVLNRHIFLNILITRNCCNNHINSLLENIKCSGFCMIGHKLYKCPLYCAQWNTYMYYEIARHSGANEVSINRIYFWVFTNSFCRVHTLQLKCAWICLLNLTSLYDIHCIWNNVVNSAIFVNFVNILSFWVDNIQMLPYDAII